jgi:hypothetical protein
MLLSHNDPTDNVLAAIASILEQPESPRELEKQVAEQKPAPEERLVADEKPAPEQQPAAEEKPAGPPPIPGDGYTRVGPGPMPTMRFKWTVREDQGNYYVDETIGENSNPIVTGPMTLGAAVKWADDREADARLKFENIKHEMTGRSAAANLVRKDGGEI